MKVPRRDFIGEEILKYAKNWIFKKYNSMKCRKLTLLLTTIYCQTLT
jgi:hypothetical protein